MADVDELNDAGAADGEKDLVADFLMREQDKLAGLEDDFGMSNIRSPPHNVASVGVQSKRRQTKTATSENGDTKTATNQNGDMPTRS